MATFRARVVQEGGAWVASAVALPNCWSRAPTREQALAKLRDEIRYRIEYCPCTGVEDSFVQVELVDAAGARDGAARPAGGAAAAPASVTPAVNAPAAAPAARTPAELSGVAGCPGPRRRGSRDVPSVTTGGPGAALPANAPRVPAAGSGWRRWDD